MTTGIYMRHSTDNQTNESQRHALEAWVAEQSEPVDIRWFEDHAMSGTRADRPGWLACLAAMRSGEVKRLVCFRKDRLGRDMPTRMRLTAELCDLGVELVSLNEQTDLESPEGLLLEAMAGYLAASERRAISQRITAGIAKVKGTGGRWDKAQESRRTIRAHNQGAFLAMRERGASWEEIGALYGVHPKSAARIFRRLRCAV